jgi:hypothetical protein
VLAEQQLPTELMILAHQEGQRGRLQGTMVRSPRRVALSALPAATLPDEARWLVLFLKVTHSPSVLETLVLVLAPPGLAHAL